MKKQKSYYLTPTDTKRDWHLIDASGLVLGRLASQVANILRGKHKATYTPSVDGGDHVIIINAEKVRVTGKKETDKVYYKHTGYTGGLKEITLGEQRKKDASKLIYDAVKGMLPHNRLGRQMLTKVRIYNGTEHEHEAQNPVKLEIS